MSPSRPSSLDGLEITPALLRRWPLPQPDRAGDKEERGQVLVVGGEVGVPGAVILSATAALRAGAGKLRLAAAASVAPLLAVAVPEARVFALPEGGGGAPIPTCAERLAELAAAADAIVLGPGLIDEASAALLLGDLLPRLEKPAVILDAGALAVLREHPEALHRFGGRAVITPHHGEMAALLGIDREAVRRDPPRLARDTAAQLGAVVALKGDETVIAGPGGELFVNRAGNVGLATSGSGDTLSGIVGGLAARGADALQSAVWGVSLHARAGDRLAARIGPVGYLARELLDEIPGVMHDLGRDEPKRGKDE